MAILKHNQQIPFSIFGKDHPHQLSGITICLHHLVERLKRFAKLHDAL